YLTFTFALLYIPIFYLIFYSFNKGGDMNQFTGMTFDHYQTLFSDSRLMSILLQTFLLAFLSALLATVIGTFGAIYIHHARQK
ncbi:ABC transporter permease, partial [Streptococcus uberis]|nr:ABC transporter permease [Streptococcus uberis]